jgi:hypothetical protein
MKLVAGIFAAIALALFASPAQAAEGLLMVETTVAGTTSRTSRVQIEKDRLRAEVGGAAGGETQIVVFDGPQQVLRYINFARKSYTEMTKADADRMGAQLSTVMEGMKEKIAKMPPEQRARMEAAMGRMGGAGAAAAPVRPDYKKTGTDKVGKWTCDKYEGFRGGVKVAEVCTVDPKVLGMTQADLEISKQVAAFFKTLLPMGGDQMVGVGTIETQGFAGIPVRRIRYNGSAVASTSEVVEVSRQTFDDASYAVPAGFQKQSMGMK